MSNAKGYISFVGAGPGDIGLITQKGLQCIKKADVILYDRLANPRLLRYASDHCEFHYCGKLPNRHIMRQDKINETLVQYAKAGKYVVRLKGGDPSVFGRVGEEAEALAEHQIPYEIVPGVTSSIAAATYAGIPVTHREYSNSFTLRTGHVCTENNEAKYQENQIGDTIAYYMGVKSLDKNCKELIKQGRKENTKVAVIEWGTLGKQRVVEGTLASIAEIVKNESIQSPAMMLVGDVVLLRKQLSWFDKKRFKGKRLLIAKATKDDYRLENYFTFHGAEAYSFPVMRKQSVTFSADELNSIMRSERLIFNNPESVKILLDQLLVAGYDSRHLPRRIEFISKKTGEELWKRGILGHQATDRSNAAIISSKFGHSEEATEKEYYSHEWITDKRFRDIHERVLKEDSWETVIFPNKAAVRTFIEELDVLYMAHLKKIRFAYIGESVKELALKLGFSTIDDEIQNELNRQEWRGSQ